MHCNCEDNLIGLSPTFLHPTDTSFIEYGVVVALMYLTALPSQLNIRYLSSHFGPLVHAAIMPAAKVEESGESSNAATKAALAASSNGSVNYELPWYESKPGATGPT